jgi:hypothetical protein
MLLTIGPGGCGFTFLNWSISFLRGDSFYQTLDGVQHKIISNPLLNSVAHKYVKDHLRIEDSKNQFSLATEQSIIYAVPGDQKDFEYLLALPGKKIIFDASNCSKILLARAIVNMSKSVSPYSIMIEKLSKDYSQVLVQEVLLDCHKLFMQYYKLPPGLNNVYTIDYNDLFDQLNQEIPKIFEYLGIQLDPDRLVEWHKVYAQYKQLNQRDYYTELVPYSSTNNKKKNQIFKEILKWRNGSSQPT